MKKILFMAILSLMILGACQKEEINPSVPALEEGVGNPDPGDSGDMQLKIASSTILNATDASKIPSEFFKVSQMYKDSYIHLKQRPSECSWTSYVICVGAIARANNKTYPTTLTQVSTVRDKCIEHAGGYENGMAIGELNWYAGQYDNTKISRSLIAVPKNNPGAQFTAIKQMLSHINNYHTPFVVRSSINGGGHYRIVFSIDWKKNQTGSIVYYTDCNFPAGVSPGVPTNSSVNGNLQSMDLTQFMGLMIVGANNYNMLFIRP